MPSKTVTLYEPPAERLLVLYALLNIGLVEEEKAEVVPVEETLSQLDTEEEAMVGRIVKDTDPLEAPAQIVGLLVT